MLSSQHLNLHKNENGNEIIYLLSLRVQHYLKPKPFFIISA